jgi:hypothetical protein
MSLQCEAVPCSEGALLRQSEDLNVVMAQIYYHTNLYANVCDGSAIRVTSRACQRAHCILLTHVNSSSPFFQGLLSGDPKELISIEPHSLHLKKR